MNEFLKTVLSLSVSGTLLLFFVLGLKPLYKDKFSKCWQYYIWIVVALRFLLPFTSDTTIVGSLFENSRQTAVVNEISVSMDESVPVSTDNNKETPVRTDRIAAAANEPFSVYGCLFFLWSAWALVLFIRRITLYQGFSQSVKTGSADVSDIRTLKLLSDCEEKLNIKTRTALSRHPLTASPMLIGFFRPKIILPVRELEDNELSFTFLHELVHRKRMDMFYKWLVQIVVCAHWFNPFVYLLEKEVNKACELSCDEKVISMLDETARRAYGDTLILFLHTNNLRKNAFASVTLSEGAKQLKERLGAIMYFKRKSKTVKAMTMIFTTVICIGYIVAGAYAAPVQAGQTSEKKNANHAAEYAGFGITAKGSAYYYNGSRIRIFHDMRADDSFENSFVDLKGTVDVRLARGKRGTIQTLNLIPKAEADEILEDLFGYVPSRKKVTTGKKQKQSPGQKETVTKTKKNEYTGIKRCELGDIPSGVQTAIKKRCAGNSWYVVETRTKKYVYYNHLPGDYAFDISGTKLNVRDIGRHTGIYVLLSLGNDFDFTLSYNGKPVTFMTIDTNSDLK